MLVVFCVYLFILSVVGYYCIAKHSLINIYSIIVFSLFIVYVLPYLDPDCPFKKDQYFATVISIGLIGFLISFFLASFLQRQQLQGKKWLNNQYARLKGRNSVISVLAVAGIIFIWLSIFLALPSLNIADIIAFLLRNRIKEYHEIGLFNRAYYLDFLKTFFMIPVYLEIFRLWKNRRHLAWFYFGTLLLELIFFSHVRFGILTLLVLPFIYYHFTVKPIAAKKLVIMICCLIVLTGIFNVIRGGGYNAMTPITTSDSKAEFLYKQLTRAGAGSTETFYEMYQKIQRDVLNIELGEQYGLMLFTPIPRFVWPDKPIVSYFGRLTEYVEGRLPGIGGQAVLTSTILGEAYHEFGLAGVFIAPIVLIMLIYFFVLYLGRFENTELIIWTTLIHLPMDIRGGLSSTMVALTQKVVIFFLLSIIIYVSSRRWNRYNPLKSLFPF